MVERRRVVAAPYFHQPADEGEAIEQQGQDGPRQRHPLRRAARGLRQRRRQAGIALAGDGGVGAAADDLALQEERAERQHQQQDGKRGGPSVVELRADHREIDLGRQHAVVAAQHDGIAEVGDAFDEADQEGVGEAGPHQRQRHGGEGRPRIGAQGLRGFLEGGAHTLDDADQHQERHRREGEELGQEDAAEAVDPARRRHAHRPFEELVDQARTAEHQDQRQADDERRRDDGQDGQHAQRLLETERGPRDDQRESEPQRRRAGGAGQR